MGSISNISSSFLQSAIGKALQYSGLAAAGGSSVNSTSSVGQAADGQKLSPLTKLLSVLQQLQHTDPAKYKQVTQQISTNLQDASQKAQSDGNSPASALLSQLSADFSKASTSGDLPDIQDLAKAVGGGHRRHHHAHSSAGSTDTNSSPGTGSATTGVSQLLAALQANSPQDDSQNPMSIILKTLSDAGISGPAGS